MKTIRSCRTSLKFITKDKQRKIKDLIKEYRRIVNLYIKYLWNNKGKLDKQTLDIIQKTSLTARYKSNALKQALETVIFTKKSLKVNKKYTNKIPHFSGNPVLDAKFITIENGNKSFDLIIKLSTPQRGRRIALPTKKTSIFNKWMNYPNSKLIQGGILYEDKIILFIEIPIEQKQEGEILGIDLGINKLIATSNREFFGQDFKQLKDKINRKKRGSKASKRAYAERLNYINQQLNKLDWDNIKTLVIEDLKNLKQGKKKNRGKSFRKSIAPWTYSQVISRMEAKSQENRVCLVKVNPQNTSRTCPICKNVAIENRKNEEFKCSSCGHQDDADTVGAINIRERFVGNLEFSIL